MTKKIFLTHTLLGLTFIPAMTPTMLAEQPGGEIIGTVVDPSGALVPGAQVTLVNASGFTRTMKTSPTGTFNALHLAPGSYSVSVDAIGFTPALEGGIKVANDGVTSDQIKLRISVNQEIEVRADDDDAVNAPAGSSEETANHR